MLHHTIFDLLCLIPGLGFILWGALYKILPPKNITCPYGFRSDYSLRTTELWKLGNSIYSSFLVLIGVISIVMIFVASSLIASSSFIFGLTLSIAIGGAIATHYLADYSLKVFIKNEKLKAQL